MGYEKFEGLNLITDEYKKAVGKSILINELGINTQTTGYELSYASTGKSGWSFGGEQLDLGTKRVDTIALMKDIYTKQYGVNSWTSSLEASLTAQNNSNSLTNEQKSMINIALSSAYGKNAINQKFIQDINNYTSYVDKIETELQKVKSDLNLSEGEKLMLIDYHNQYNLDMDTSVPGSMLKKIQDYIKLNEDITTEGLVTLFKTTPQYEKNPISQGTRITNTYKAATILDATTNFSQSTPTAQTPTTIYDLSTQLNVSIAQLEESNPWLRYRSSDNLASLFNYSSNQTINLTSDTGIDYSINLNDLNFSSVNQQQTTQTQSATANDALNFIANFDGSMSDLQQIQSAVNEAYSNGLSKEYVDAFNSSFNTYVSVNSQSTTVTTQPTYNSTRIDKNAFYEYNTITDTAQSLASKTFAVLDSNNKGLSVQELKLLDVNNDKQLSNDELVNLKTWIDINEDGMAQSNEISTISASGITNIEEIDYVLHANAKNTLIDPSQVVFKSSGGTYSGTTNGIELITGSDSVDNIVSYGDNVLSGSGNDLVGIRSINNIVYSGAGDDIIFNDNLYSGNSTIFGGSGNDTIDGGNGNDYIDGGTGADLMRGGLGDDIYIVNSVNDNIKEDKNAGNDTIFSSVNYVLEKNVETLRLIEGFNINGTGNSGDNTLIGNSANNILDGLNGNDTMRGGLGDDSYYVDSADDVVIEKALSGNDIINSYVSTSLANLQNVENVQLLDFSMSEMGNINGKDVYVYGHPKRVELDYSQGDAVDNYWGTCSLTAISNLLTQSGKPTSEGDVINLAINKQLTTTTGTSIQLGGTTRVNQINILKEFGIDAKLSTNNKYSPDAIAQYVLSGRGVLVAVNAGQLWGNQNTDDGSVDHVVLVSGVVYDTTGNLNGFYIADSGRGTSEDTNRYLTLDEFKQAVAVPYAYFIYTTQPILDVWNKDISAVGNDNNNILYGNMGNNELYGKGGDDTLAGGAGEDYLDGGYGNDTYKIALNDGKDVVFDIDGNDTMIFSDIKKSEIKVVQIENNLVIYGLNTSGSVTIQGWFSGNKIENISFSDGTLSIANIESLIQSRYTQSNYQIGTNYNDQIIGANAQNQIEGGAGNDIIKGGFGSDVLKGDAGNDTIYGYNGKDLIYGGDGDDFLSGGDESDLIFGGTGNDTLQGGIGDDILEGEDGNDLLQGDDGNDLIYGGNGNDTIYGNNDNDILYGEDGNDTLYGNAGNDKLGGGAGDDKLIGGDGDDTYYFSTGYGNDIISDTQGSNQVIFGEGITKDNIVVSRDGTNLVVTLNTQETLVIESWYAPIDANYQVETKPLSEFIFADGTVFDTNEIMRLTKTLGSNGDDSIAGTSENDNLYGLDGNDIFVANTGDDYIDGGLGDDTIDGGAGNDTMIGGLGNDVYAVDSIEDVIIENANEGTLDKVYSSITYTLGDNLELLTLSGSNAINGTGNALNNYILGNSANNIIDGELGDDTIDGGAGNDTMIGGLGNDVYAVDSIGDVIVENANEGTLDKVYSSITYTLGNNLEILTLSGSNAINGTGNALNNYITGNSANNIIDGGLGDDTIDGGAGNDTMIGGLGNDVYAVDSVGDVIIENANEGTLDKVYSSITYTLGNNLELLTLSGSNAINGTGNAANNNISGNSANNTIDGGAGDDIMSGGTGNDTYVVDSVYDIVNENANEGVDLIQSSVTYTLSTNVENLTLTGTNAISGTGNSQNNYILGNSANNIIDGGAGDDYIDGGAGDDTILSGAGNDTMIGGLGNDVYAVDSIGDVIVENANEGTLDKVYSSITYTLGNNLEILTLSGSNAINGTGNALNNYITGNSANNIIDGGLGDDTIDGGAGNDTMIGGLGNDVYVVDSIIGDVIVENANEGTLDKVYSSITYTLGNNLEILTLSGSNAINGTGNALNNYITGNSANNIIDGGLGDDTIDGGAGNDTMIGGLGNDVYAVDSVGDVIIENANEGTLDKVYSSITYTLGNNLELLTLSGSNAINGTGNSANNNILGNSASNIIDAGAGDDIVDGGAGNDTLMGGLGNDIYKFSIGSNKDTITDIGGTDNILFDTTVSKSNIAFYLQSNKDLTLQYSTNDSISVSSWGNTANKIEKVSLSDGNYLSSSDIDNLIQSMTSYATTKGISLSSVDNVSKNAELMTMIANTWHK